MALKKPSDFFNKTNPIDQVQDQLKVAAPEKVEKISEAFNVFKTNLNNIQTLSDFSSTVDGFKENFERIDILSKEIEDIKENISSVLTKEDLDSAMMSHLLFVEQSIESIQDKIKSLNSKTLLNIKEEFSNIQETVFDFINIEIPEYKKQIIDSERRIDNRFLSLKENVNQNIRQIDNDFEEKISSISNVISGINEDYLIGFKEEISSLEEKVDYVLEDELPRYQKFFAETELKTSERITEVSELIKTKLRDVDLNYSSKVEDLNQTISEFIEKEIPKYKSLITDSKIRAEKDIQNLEDSFRNKFDLIENKVLSLIEESIDNNKSFSDNLSEKLLKFQNIINESKYEIDSVSNTYENLYKDFRKREIHENEKLESYEEKLENFSKKINILENNLSGDILDLKNNLNISTSNYYDVLKKEVGYFEESILSKVKDLEVNIVINEKHINSIKKSVYDVLDDLKLDLIEEKSKELTDKINHVESILEKFNEKIVLNEDSTFTINSPADTKTSDPLTPLDKNYVTLDDLQSHYRLFINRVQQQLATIGGGGAGFIKDLADVSFDESTGTDKLLIFNGTNWVGIASTALSGSLINLNDVNASNLGDGRFLRYDASTSEFTFAPVSASNLELIAGDIQSGILTTNSTSPATIMSVSASTYRSVNYQVQITEGTNYNMTTINVIHDGSNTYMIEYGTINHPIGVATFSSDISGGSLRLIGYPAFASQTTFKVVFTAIEA